MFSRLNKCSVDVKFRGALIWLVGGLLGVGGDVADAPRAGLAMAFKLIESAQQRWRAVNASHLVALVRAGAGFDAGKLVECEFDDVGDEAAA